MPDCRRSLFGPALLKGVVLAAGLAACHRGTTAAPATSLAANPSCVTPGAASSTSLASTPIADPLVTFDTAWSIVARTHWDSTYNGVDWKGLRDKLRPRAAQAKTTGELRAVLSEMVGSLKQSHFSIIPREVSDATSGEGNSASDANGTTGATFRYVGGSMVVSHVPAGSAADKAGVRTGWTLDAVSGCPISTRLSRIPRELDARRIAFMAFSTTNQLLAGSVGDTVQATFLDGRGARQTVGMVRQREAGTMAKFGNLPPFPAELAFERVTRGDKTIGVIRFNIWMPILSAQFDAAIDSLRGSDAIIVDIRGNFGGVVGMAPAVGGHFLDTAQTIGTMKQRGQSLKFVANPRLVNAKAQSVKPFSGPVALLVDELSVSTSEIFAGGMQALGRVRVFGTQTSGQALPSVPERLPNGDILYHAIADFLSPAGKSLEGDGVRPDEVVPLTRKALLEGKDPARDAALAWAVKSAAMPRKGATPE